MLTIIRVNFSKKTNKCYLEVDNGVEIAISLDLVMEYQLSVGLSINNDLYEEIIRKHKIISAKQTVHNYVAYKPRTKYQIEQKLKDKEFDNEVIELALDFACEFGYVDDEKYAQMFVQDYLRIKSYGLQRAYFELIKRGIEKSLAENVIRQFEDKNEEWERAQKLADKKIQSIRSKPAEKRKRALVDFLQRRGFNWDIIHRILKDNDY